MDGKTKSNRIMKTVNTLLALLLLAVACTREPEPIVFGKDFCVFCKMTILDPRYAAEVITTKGKIFKFDDLLCAQKYCEVAELDSHMRQGIYVTSFQPPHAFLNLEMSLLVKAPGLRSPMGGDVAAFALADSQTVRIMIPDSRLVSWPAALTSN
jgi:copper chaperone NosL